MKQGYAPVWHRPETLLERMQKFSPYELKRLVALKIPLPLRRDGPNSQLLNGFKEGVIIRSYQRGGRRFFLLEVKTKEGLKRLKVSSLDLDMLAIRMKLAREKN